MTTATRGSPRAQRALAFLRRRIVSGEWPVNTRIPTEPELVELIGVGRGTVREAVRTLANLGMLETLVSRGTYVRSRFPVSSVLVDFIAEFDLGEIVGFRRALEVEAAQQAATHRSDADLAALRAALGADVPADVDYPRHVERGRLPGQFHHLLFEATGNRLMISLYGGVMAGLRTAIDRDEIIYGASAEVRRTDHTAILAAVEAGDPVQAAHAMTAHADRDLILPANRAVTAEAQVE
ncbi:GntR domain protein [Nostocoides japonicum T1-X7]|uniref:GntR domain protein n=1 Tax=Nostocoides japonicum T1-X7 TaxID=1194083 RepID=A0A077LY72_9MICO|nr:FCD domain-containing protein [Tetrasphaera japonica]CCH76890.1 GntR domain protein [Tetrasphaera japonica T1-X7]